MALDKSLLPWYHGNINTKEQDIPPKASKQMQSDSSPTASVAPLAVERVQTGVRMEKRMVKVLKALAEYQDLSLGDLLEGIVLHAFANRLPFSPETLQRIAQLKDVYGMTYDVAQSHRLVDDRSAHDCVVEADSQE